MQATSAVEAYADPAWVSATGRPGFSARLLELARGSESGSDHQLAFVNTWLAGKLNDDQIPAVRGLLDGDDPTSHGLTGLVVDTDMRWKLVRALASAGAIDTDPASSPVIDAEAGRDNTATGQRQAAAARASRPLAEAKADAWAQAVEDDSLSNVYTR
ncbi:aminopeptidase N, partial [Streptomyces sp. SID10244]|nr:aminopeptidase N [Streptomyces sp. SID10244]